MEFGVHPITAYIENIPCFDNDYWHLFSAVIMAIAEQYSGHYFKVFSVDRMSFNLVINRIGTQRIEFRRFRLNGNRLYYTVKHC